MGSTSINIASTSGPRQAGISEQDSISCKLKLMLVQQVKNVDRSSLRQQRPGRNPRNSLKIQWASYASQHLRKVFRSRHGFKLDRCYNLGIIIRRSVYKSTTLRTKDADFAIERRYGELFSTNLFNQDRQTCGLRCGQRFARSKLFELAYRSL